MATHALLVEDSPIQAQLMQAELHRHGLTVDIADTGTAGLNAAQRHLPDVIILDVELPGINIPCAGCSRPIPGPPRSRW